jgi:hypothetical protein
LAVSGVLQGTEKRLHDRAGLIVILRHEVRIGPQHDLFGVAEERGSDDCEP